MATTTPHSSTTRSPTTTATASPLSCTDHCATMDILVIIEVTFHHHSFIHLAILLPQSHIYPVAHILSAYVIEVNTSNFYTAGYSFITSLIFYYTLI